MSTITENEIAHWRSWVGREEVRREVLSTESLRRFSAAVGSDLNVETTPPPLAHWAFFLPVAAGDTLGPDGHPARGGFLPPVALPRRMFAASAIQFEAPLILEAEAQMVSTVAEVKHRSGRTGDLVFVEVARVITQNGELCVRERQTVVYRGKGDPVAAVVPVESDVADGAELWLPGPVDLFRFSSVTFNSHRIHYDLPYATQQEGYPGLVVHGPFSAAKLYGYAERRLGKPLRAFSFRANAPIFVSQPVLLTSTEAPGGFQAVRCDGVISMVADANV